MTLDITGNTLKVTGFDFSKNWCGSRSGTYMGKKLIVEFIVKEREGFLGGNNVPTNVGTDDGIYNSNGVSFGQFESPTVDVAIPDVTVTAQDKNVYLLHTMTDDECKDNATATCNGVNLFNESEYTGDNAWKAAFVDITTAITKPEGTLTADGSYKISATVAPKRAY